MWRIIQQRDFWVFVLLNVITCGIYGIYFWYMWNEDVNRICAGDGQDMAVRDIRIISRIRDGETLILGQDGGVCNHIIMGNAIEAKHCSIVYRKWDNCYIVTDYSMGGTCRASDDTRLPTGGRTELTAGTVIYLGNRATMYRLG